MAATRSRARSASDADPPDDDDDDRAEHRWPVAIALLVGVALYLTLPSTLLAPMRWVVAGILVAALVPLVILNPHRLRRETPFLRWVSAGVGLLLLVANTVALVGIVIVLIAGEQRGPQILLAVLQVWITQVIAFAMVFWEIDRGGPVARRHLPREKVPRADFRFPQDEDHDAIDEVAARSSQRSGWMPGYLDYLYFSASNSMAFSPTDTMPLSGRAKLLMMTEAFLAFVTLALVIARAVSLLGGG